MKFKIGDKVVINCPHWNIFNKKTSIDSIDSKDTERPYRTTDFFEEICWFREKHIKLDNSNKIREKLGIK